MTPIRRLSGSNGGQQTEDLVGSSQFSEHREDPIEAASVRIAIQIRNGIDGDGDIVSMFKCLACGGFDSHARGDAGQDDTSHSAAAQLQIEVSSKKRAPLAFGDQDVAGLLVEPILEFGIVWREWSGRASSDYAQAQSICFICRVGHANEHNGKAKNSKPRRQAGGICKYGSGRINGRQPCHPLLEIDEDKCRFADQARSAS